jgi:hypothetical protein
MGHFLLKVRYIELFNTKKKWLQKPIGYEDENFVIFYHIKKIQGTYLRGKYLFLRKILPS